MELPPMPTSFFGLFFFSTALSLVCTFAVVAALSVVRKLRRPVDHEPPRLR